MTAQIGERLLLDGAWHVMHTEPLADFFEQTRLPCPFVSGCTALWRGYLGKWKVEDDRLYLIGIWGRLANGSPGKLSTLFPDARGRVFAHWFSGTVKLPQGRRLEYVHMGYRSVYERYLLLHFERGVLRTREQLHHAPREGGP